MEQHSILSGGEAAALFEYVDQKFAVIMQLFREHPEDERLEVMVQGLLTDLAIGAYWQGARAERKKDE